MHLIRSATLTVKNLQRSQSDYCQWLDYRMVEQGQISHSLAISWGAKNTEGCPYCVLQPASNAPVYIRLIQQPIMPDYKPLRTYGWAAIEICNQDTLAVNDIMNKSPFDIIGPPKTLDGMPEIFPMQVRGPDKEIVYLTEIRGDLKAYDLPRAESLIDKLFILVSACSDIDKTSEWLEKHVLVSKGQPVKMIYSMINKSFDLPKDTKHALMTLQHDRDVFLQIDAYPEAATSRTSHPGMLPPCTAIGSFVHPDFDKLAELNKAHWITPPTRRDGEIYKGKRAATLRDPDGTLIELIEL